MRIGEGHLQIHYIDMDTVPYELSLFYELFSKKFYILSILVGGTFWFLEKGKII